MKENKWNEFLRDQLPITFVTLFQTIFKDDPKHQLQYSWIKYMPEAGEVSDPFFGKRLDQALYHKLESYERLVSASGVWKFPKMLIIDGVEFGASATEFNLGFGVVLEMTGLEFAVHPKTRKLGSR